MEKVPEDCLTKKVDLNSIEEEETAQLYYKAIPYASRFFSKTRICSKRRSYPNSFSNIFSGTLTLSPFISIVCIHETPANC